MAFVDVGLALGASEAFAGIVGTAAVGAGTGAAYSAITGDGNVLNSALTGATIGGTLGAMAPTGGFSSLGASAPSTLAAPTSNVLTQVPSAATSVLPAEGGNIAVNASNQLLNSSGAVLNPATAANIPGNVAGAQSIAPTAFNNAVTVAEDAAGYGGSTNGVLNQVAGTAPYNPAPNLIDTAGKSAGLTGNQVLGYGLAGTAALSLLGGMNQKKLSSTAPGTNPAYIRPYAYSQTRNPNYGQPGQPYYIQSYTAQTPYKAAAGGLMGQGGSFISEDEQSMYPQSQMDKTQYAVSSQMPTSAEVVGSDYDAKTNAYTGLPMARFDEGGRVGLPPVPQVAAPLDVAINPATNQNQIIAPVQLPTVGYTPQAVPDANKFQNAFNQYQYESNIAPKPAPTAQVLDYSRILNQRAKDEYINSPTPAAFKAAPTQNISGLYQYYLGRTPDASELKGWENTYGRGPITPEMATGFESAAKAEQDMSGYRPQGPSPFKTVADVQAAQAAQEAAKAKTIAELPHNQSTFNADAYLAANPDVKAQLGARGVESAWAHYQNFGQKEGRNALFDVIPSTTGSSSYITNPNAAAAGLPQYTYNAATKTFGRAMPASGTDTSSPSIQDQFNELMRNYQQQQQQGQVLDGGGGGAGGGLMPGALKYAMGGATGYNLGGYSDGGRLLKGPGDGMSDNIPASIGNKQPARLADGEFVVPADVVSHLGNGSTDAGAKKLYAMMDKVRQARVGTKKQGKQIKADKYLPT